MAMVTINYMGVIALVALFLSGNILLWNIRGDVSSVRADMETGNASVRADMETGNASVRVDMEKGFSDVRKDVSQIRVDISNLSNELIREVLQNRDDVRVLRHRVTELEEAAP